MSQDELAAPADAATAPTAPPDAAPVVKPWPDGPLLPMDLAPGLTVGAERLARLEAFFEANCRNPDSAYQNFYRGYNYTAYSGPSFQRIAYCMAVLAEVAPPGGTVLDTGCFGAELLALKSERPDVAIKGLSYEGCIATVQETGFEFDSVLTGDRLEVWVNKSDLERERMPYDDESLDVVSAFEVVEHFKYGPQNFMAEAHRVLKPGGALVVTTPNINSILSIFKILDGQHPHEHHAYFRNPEYGVVHPYEFNHRELRALVEAYGFTVEVFTTFFREHYVHCADKMRVVLDFMEKAFPGTLALGLPGDKFLVVARKTGPIANPYPPEVFEG
ncbi:MAG TPA: methyltransferase domain-containing protein [Azospirillaceae bacterium]|nr:methyltransferase domain-containing protein [Azospirillaceae bacterium]